MQRGKEGAEVRMKGEKDKYWKMIVVRKKRTRRRNREGRRRSYMTGEEDTY